MKPFNIASFRFTRAYDSPFNEYFAQVINHPCKEVF